MKDKILLSLCHMGGGELPRVKQAFNTNWIVPLGPAVDEFESLLQHYLGANAVVALSAGTAAIHLALVMAGVSSGDEVICQSLTFAGGCNPIRYLGATPVLVDSEPDTWNIDPDLMRTAIKERIARTRRRPAAIIATDLYGMPARWDEIAAVAREYDIPLIEDAAEALGSTYDGRHCSTLGLYGALSFNGNKVITTSGGGALVCPSKEAARRVLFYATQAREDRPYYHHEHIGYNYRLSNVCAAIGCGQMDVLQDHVQRRRAIHDIYNEALSKIPGITVLDNPDSRFRSNFWLTTILIDRATGVDPEQARLHLLGHNIESRRLWRPMHRQPVYADAVSYVNGVADSLFDRGLCLPSGSSLTDDDIARVIDTLTALFA